MTSVIWTGTKLLELSGGGAIWSSIDGQKWDFISSIPHQIDDLAASDNRFYNIALYGNQLVAVGVLGQIAVRPFETAENAVPFQPNFGISIQCKASSVVINSKNAFNSFTRFSVFDLRGIKLAEKIVGAKPFVIEIPLGAANTGKYVLIGEGSSRTFIQPFNLAH